MCAIDDTVKDSKRCGFQVMVRTAGAETAMALLGVGANMKNGIYNLFVISTGLAILSF